jgi:hypothetical protein
MRERWKIQLLAILMIAILWILIVPNVDLDPATPMNIEALFFVVMAICLICDMREYLRDFLRCLAARLVDEPSHGGPFSATHISPLRC